MKKKKKKLRRMCGGGGGGLVFRVRAYDMPPTSAASASVFLPGTGSASFNGSGGQRLNSPDCD